MSKRPKNVLGIDIGGSGVKGAVVNAKRGVLVTERVRVPTPQPATPPAVAEAVEGLVRRLEWGGPVGCTVPARVRRGVTETASNIDHSWIGTDAAKLFRRRLGVPVIVLNDADAAGLAEMAFGAGKGEKGTTLVVTFGTGIGSALFVGKRLVPNTELGHVRFDERVAEHVAADSVRTREHLTWERWARRRVQPVLEMYEFLFAPDRIVIGGGVSRIDRWAQFGHLLDTKATLCRAELGNEAGIVGAALAGRRAFKTAAV
jgi:polyphosphate glucokinase